MKRMALFLAVAALGALTVRMSAAIQEPVKIDTGLLAGVTGSTQPSVRVFKGIPFAAPPTGENRWRAPQPPVIVPWSRPVSRCERCKTSAAGRRCACSSGTRIRAAQRWRARSAYSHSTRRPAQKPAQWRKSGQRLRNGVDA